ncbi:MAG TPA: hypothetical protein VGO89_00995, partial [Streptomyces sp.]|nr:hypothetical protein [Streptomyces sp.]
MTATAGRMGDLARARQLGRALGQLAAIALLPAGREAVEETLKRSAVLDAQLPRPVQRLAHTPTRRARAGL